MKRKERRHDDARPAAAAATAGPAEDNRHLAMSSHRRKNHVLYKILRRYADAAGLHRACGHSPCVRARRCVDAGMKCYEDNQEDWREIIFPFVRAELDQLKNRKRPLSTTRPEGAAVATRGEDS